MFFYFVVVLEDWVWLALAKDLRHCLMLSKSTQNKNCVNPAKPHQSPPKSPQTVPTIHRGSALGAVSYRDKLEV